MTDCKHTNTVTENGQETCYDCGETLFTELIEGPEWCNYGDNSAEDMCRVQFRKKHEKGIKEELRTLNFSGNIIDKANDMYMEVTKGGIKRGTSRKAIIFSCVFNAFIETNTKHTSEELREIFQLQRRDASRALTEFRKSYKSRTSLYISPVYFIPIILEKFNATEHHKDKIIRLYDFIKNENIAGIKGSNPKSISAGLIYYYLHLIDKIMDIDHFSEMSGLSKITILKIFKSLSDTFDQSKIKTILKE
jgi:transcription initiation factor TFIIIB Brf1 subunit/transcription initiation factor TFIIB